VTLFLIEQTEGKVPGLDIGFEAIEACKYNNWFNGDEAYQWKLISREALSQELVGDNEGHKVPVGCIPFMHKAFRLLGARVPVPLNVPEYLFSTARRELAIGKPSSYPHLGFGKNTLLLKQENFFGHENMPVGETLFLSELVTDIVSEWRMFVHAGKIVGLKHYAGSPWFLPDPAYAHTVKEVMNSNRELLTYSFDLMVRGESPANYFTDIVECHEFYALGMYGFHEPHILPQMLTDSFQYLKQVRS
jgi:hypothetical protein